MAKTAAEKQAAYRQRRADKLSDESTAEPDGLSPGADCVPAEDTGKEDVDLTIRDAIAVDPGIPPEPVIARSDDCWDQRFDEIVDMLNQLLLPPALGLPPPVVKKPEPKPVGDLSKCMRCGTELPPRETPRTVQELCHPCVRRNG